MVFTNLSEEDKEGFFALLDEYFASRPELAEALQLQSPNNNVMDAGVAAAHRMLANNPEATSSAISAGVKNASKFQSNKYTNAAASNPELANAIGRVAAASLAARPPPATANDSSKPPPPPPAARRGFPSASSLVGSSSVEPSPSPTPPSRAPPPPRQRASIAATSGFPAQRDIGKLSDATKKLWNSNNESPSPLAPSRAPPPLARRGMMPPLPVRAAAARTPTPEPEPEPEPEQEEEGEWAEALYDYKSSDPNDLELRAEQRVLITERTSDDWWTGQADGKTGLFPAAYVNLL